MRPKPKVMALKISESLRLRTISEARPGGGGLSFWPTRPGLAEVSPWHMTQLISKSDLPCARDAAVGVTGLCSSASRETISLPETGTLPAGGERIGALYGL